MMSLRLLLISIKILHLRSLNIGSLDPDDLKIPDVYNGLIAGECSPEGDSFCLRQVPNSMCSIEKNECLCKPGFVSVQEDGVTICKTLLTNAKCGMDTDCVDVKGSTCHPGAAFCTCPGGTVFVPQLNKCMKRVHWSTKDQLCKQCIAMKGICFQNEWENSEQNPNATSDQPFGCLCPGKNAMPKKFNDDYSNVCEALLMDIGDYCNEKYLLCRSNKAECTRRIGSLESICQCPFDSVPVYQYHLKYMECIPKLPVNYDGCSSCYSKGGQCIKNSEKSKKLRCDCGRLRNGIQSLTRFDSTELCNQNFVHVSCNYQKLRVCYIPHITPPYDELRHSLKSGMAKVFLSDDPRTEEEYQTQFNVISRDAADAEFSHTLCQLKLQRSSQTYSEEYCIDVSLRSTLLPCGLMAVKYKNGVVYSGLLQIWTDAKFPTPSRDMKFEINCKTQSNKAKTQLGQSLDRTDALYGRDAQTASSLQSIQIPQVTLKILNSKDHEIASVDESSAIKVDILLVDRNGEFNGIEVESCFISNISFSKFNTKSHSEKSIIDKGCSVSNFPLFQNLFSDTKTPSTPVHLQSSLFPAFRFSSKDENVYFRCLLRVCRHTTWCKKPSLCQENSKLKVSTYNEGDVKFVVRSVRLQVKTFDDTQIRTSLGIKNPHLKTCQYPLCLTFGHLSMIAVSFFIILLLAVFLLILLYRKHFRNCQFLPPISTGEKFNHYTFNNQISGSQPLNNIDADDCYKEFINIDPRHVVGENYYEDLSSRTSISPYWHIGISKPLLRSEVENSYCLDNIYLNSNLTHPLDSYQESATYANSTRAQMSNVYPCNTVASTLPKIVVNNDDQEMCDQKDKQNVNQS